MEYILAVPKRKKSKSRRNMHRSHHAIEPKNVVGAGFFLDNLVDPGIKVFFHIYGDKEEVSPLLLKYKKVSNNSEFTHCSDNVLANDKPSFALRHRKDSSMKAAIVAVKEGKAFGVVSSGNTGALMAISRFILGTLPNIYRPAIASVCPTKTKSFALLDLGANVDCNADSLFQFALMGSIFAKVALKIDNPEVALLNIGTEEVKGNDSVRGAFELLKNAPGINFKGYIEASEFLEGNIDVIVADGFVGNVMLKTAEATASTFINLIKQEVLSSWAAKMLVGILLKSRLNKALTRFNPKIRSGAMFLGLNGIIIKSHGNSDAISFAHAIKFAINAISENLNQKIINGVIETSDEWIRRRTGIVQRHIADEGELTSDLAVNAAKSAIEKAKISVDEIDLIIVATTTPDKTLPSCATIVQSKLKCKNAFSFDVQAACSGFIYAVTVADSLIKSNDRIKYALVIGAEIMSRIVDWEDRSTCVLFGDGAGAVVMKSEMGRSGIISTNLHSDGNVDILCTNGGISSTGDSGKICMNGREVFKHAVDKLTALIEETLKYNNLKITDIDWLIPHQANIRIIEAVVKKLDFPIEKVINTVDQHANTSAASIPLALDYAIQESKIKLGDQGLLIAIGAGLTWGSVLLRY
ncbi:phosphate acyltransferase [Trichonephila inaurata madagascariensis]|uniref:beta-ketoacyl-[acyl-carrier-protein] synthase III n=1 Tax=Trichonephila inaurata madagascariensis TaxID=2747483 RepID=A0A8X7CP08_9ARAC|nr:phosphate acyltransferase [Trichonephila inaurata madagascariensis]